MSNDMKFLIRNLEDMFMSVGITTLDFLLK